MQTKDVVATVHRPSDLLRSTHPCMSQHTPNCPDKTVFPQSPGVAVWVCINHLIIQK